MMDAISQFLWGDGENSNRMHSLAWWKLYYPKNEGCMGYRDFESFNLTMLAKQVWRLINDPNSLCSRVLRAKYYPDGDILKAGPKSGCSFTWQGILAGVSTFKDAIYGELGMEKCKHMDQSMDSVKLWLQGDIAAWGCGIHQSK
jgi:hypothetical protein